MNHSPLGMHLKPDLSDTESHMIPTDIEAEETSGTNALALKNEPINDEKLTRITDEIATLTAQKCRLDEENQHLRNQNFEFQNHIRTLETKVTTAQINLDERDTQVQLLTKENSTLLRSLEQKETQSASLSLTLSTLKSNLETLETRYASLVTFAATHEAIATQATQDSEKHLHQVQHLRDENQQLRATNGQLQLQTQVELEALQDQLQVRKTKHYHVLETLQAYEETTRQREQQLVQAHDQARNLYARNHELEVQLQVESNAKQAQQDANHTVSLANKSLQRENHELQTRCEKAEHERMQMEAETRDSADRLREMAEKVFQLLERLKVAELSKTKAMDGLKHKEMELLALQKKQVRGKPDDTLATAARIKFLHDQKTFIAQIQALKKRNAHLLALRSNEDEKTKRKETQERTQVHEKLETLRGRITFLLNKIQVDEEATLVRKKEMHKLQTQLLALHEQNTELSHQLSATTDNHRIVTEALASKQTAFEAQSIQLEALKHQLATRKLVMEQTGVSMTSKDIQYDLRKREEQEQAATTATNRFVIECQNSNQFRIQVNRIHSTLATQQQARTLLHQMEVNLFLKRAQTSPHSTQLFIEHIAALLNTLVTKENALFHMKQQLETQDQRLVYLSRTLQDNETRLQTQETAKRKLLLRYVHEAQRRPSEFTDDGSGILKLNESGIGDDEVHAIAALLQPASHIHELQLGGNAISSHGAQAIAALLSLSTSSLRFVDLRQNQIDTTGLQVLTQALQQKKPSQHVVVHAGGKIQVLDTTSGTFQETKLSVLTHESTTLTSLRAQTVCLVDVREQRASEPNGSKSTKLLIKEKHSSRRASTAVSALDHKPHQLLLQRPVSSSTMLKEEETTVHGQWMSHVNKIESTLSPLSSSSKLLPPLLSSSFSDNTITTIKSFHS